MADLPELETWEAGVRQFELTDPVRGGADGVDNIPLKQLANRSKWLKAQLGAIQTFFSGLLSSHITDPNAHPIYFKYVDFDWHVNSRFAHILAAPALKMLTPASRSRAVETLNQQTQRILMHAATFNALDYNFNSANNTITVLKNGLHNISAQVIVYVTAYSSAITHNVQAYIYINGVATSIGSGAQSPHSPAYAAEEYGLHIDGLVQLNVNDIIELRSYNDGSAPAWFSLENLQIHRLPLVETF